MFTMALGQVNLREERLLAASLVPEGPKKSLLPVEPSSTSRLALVPCNSLQFASGLNRDWAGDFRILKARSDREQPKEDLQKSMQG